MSLVVYTITTAPSAVSHGPRHVAWATCTDVRELTLDGGPARAHAAALAVYAPWPPHGAVTPTGWAS